MRHPMRLAPLKTCLLTTLLTASAAPVLAEEDLVNDPRVVAACTAKGAVVYSATRNADGRIVVSCREKQVGSMMTPNALGGGSTMIPVMYFLPLLFLAAVDSTSSTTGTN